MSRFDRIGVVFRKDFTDALRDRRTLMAMVVVPVVLYPLLMIVVTQALKVQRSDLERKEYRVAVPDEGHRVWLEDILAAEEARLAEFEATASGPAERGGFHAVIRPDQFHIEVNDADPSALLQEEKVHLVLRVEPSPALDTRTTVNRTVQLLFDQAEVVSRAAQDGLSDILDRHAAKLVDARLKAAGITRDTLSPIAVAARSLASPAKVGGAILGQIMPFLLVIITVTGAIYPAIDLTAGERERGTLETLMAAPVPVMQLVAGKFLVIVAISLSITTLNLTSIGATFHFIGLDKQLLPGDSVTGIPLSVLPMILGAMLPFVVLFSAVMLAVCSFARTFKEAQNYMMPVIMAAMIPAMIVSYTPTLELKGLLAVTPVANVVALLRELFLGKYDPTAISLVLGSTCLYAAAAVLLATQLYGKEAVLFTDVGSYKTLLHRRLIRPSRFPTSAVSVMLLALVFPVQFYWQTGLVTMESTPEQIRWALGSCQIFVYALPALALIWYFKLNWRDTLSLRMPSGAATLGSALIAAGLFPTVLGLTRLMQLAGLISDDSKALQGMQALLSDGPMWERVLYFALLPAICEELLYRGFFMAGLRSGMRPLPLWLVVGTLFGLYHLVPEKIAIVAVSGVILTYVCWRTGCILLAMLIHLFNNAGGVVISALAEDWKGLADWLDSDAVWIAPVAGAVLVVAGLAIIAHSPLSPIQPATRRARTPAAADSAGGLQPA